MKTLIEIGAIQALFYLIYLVWLQKETDYSRKRMFLLLSTLLSVLIPFIQLPAPESVREVSQAYGMVLPAFDYHAIQAEATDRFAWDSSEITTYTSMIVSTLFILMIGISVMQVIVMYQRSTAYAYGNRYVYSNSAIKQSFSFFNWIFSRELNPSVIAHEEAHVRLKHTYDILILQLFRAACWWSPFAWLALKEMKMIHEYQADAVAIKNRNIDEYQQLLISSTLSSMGWGLASSFHDGSLLKRLHAMKLQTKKISNWKISTLGVLVAIIALTFACEELDQDIKKMSEDSRQIGFEELPDDIQSRFKGKSEDFTYMVIYVDQSEGIKPSEKLSQLQDVDPALIESVHVVKNDKAGEVYLVLRKDAKSYGYVEEKSKASDEVFTIVEQQPEFPGGMTAFYEFIATNLEYPADAKASGLEGRVFVQFIVDTDGSLKDVKTVKGIGGGCDEEAERVLAKSPKFTPGKQRGKPVKVRMVLPVTFSLENNAIILEKMDDSSKQNKVIEDIKNEPGITLKIEQTEEPLQSSELVFADGKEISKVKQAADTEPHLLATESVKASTATPFVPAYEGGMDQLYQDIFDELNYPEQAKKYKIEGNVAIQFTVRRDGSIENVTAIKGIGGGCEEEAVRVVKTLNKFKPALKEGQPIDATMVLPINFRL